ncbi:hypothetical protein R3P38DRAFT_3219760 [Favolaschia claudopus]|uniref:Uncharacterized protein n=2 Tax=Favolaschia claudopus TaxID=2862362 RepID=A0AAW0A211_9AGAR
MIDKSPLSPASSRPQALSILHRIKVVDSLEFKYVGIRFTSIQSNVFAAHYAVKSSKARAIGNAAFALKHRIGSLPVREGLVLPRHRLRAVARTPGRAAYLFAAVAWAQFSFHASRSVHKNRSQRLLRGLSRLRYMLGFTDPRVVVSALQDSVSLAEEGKSGWAGDLLIVFSRLPTPILLKPRDLLCLETIEQVCKDVEAIVIRE